MERLPLFGSFKNFVMTQRSQLKEGWDKGEWGYLVSYILFVGFLVLVTYWGARAAYFAAHPKSSPAVAEVATNTPSIAPPPIVATGTTTVYGSQAISNSPGSTQIQGEGNTIITKPDPEPVTQYSLRTPSILQNDGLYHAQIEVRIAYPKFGHLEVGPKLLSCKEINRTTGLVSRLGIDAFYGVGLIINLECRSNEPIVENVGYFFYRNE